MILAGAEHTMTLNGYLVSLTVMKDIPEAEFFGREESIVSKTTGHGPHFNHIVCSLLNPNIPLTGELGLDVIAQSYSLHIDLWQFTLLHLACLLHILFLSCYLRVTQPIILTIWSASVSDIFFSNTLVTVWSILSDQDQLTFMQGHSAIS